MDFDVILVILEIWDDYVCGYIGFEYCRYYDLGLVGDVVLMFYVCLVFYWILLGGDVIECLYIWCVSLFGFVIDYVVVDFDVVIF